MSGVYELRHRVLRERLEEVAMAAGQAHDEEYVRLALCCLALLERHKVDDKGRCRRCPHVAGWWRLGSRRCSVVPVVGFYLEQPSRMVTAQG